MYCYKCGLLLGDRNFCPHCGADVSTYKKIIYVSNHFYNEGLEKAQVRDLSGAVVSLRQSLRFNKENIDARNLLGLVYFEMGESVAAMSEWVISNNIQGEQNLASAYLNEIQKNQNKLETLSQTIKKYNQALAYCYQGSLDLAVIQLRKVLSLNPHFVRARQLLALLYINDRSFGKARRQLNECRAIDVGNTTTLRYLREIEKETAPEAGASARREGVSQDGDVVTYTSGNETIIQPAHAHNPIIDASGLPGTALNIIIGALVGAAVIGFLVLPARVQSIRRESAEQVRVISEQSDERSAKIAEQEQRIAALEKENGSLAEMVGAAASSGALETLETAAAAYITDPEGSLSSVVETFGTIDPEAVNAMGRESFTGLYRALYGQIRPQLVEAYFQEANEAFTAETPDYEKAAAAFERTLRSCSEDGEYYVPTLYDLSLCWYRLYVRADESAKEGMVTDLARAQRYLQTIVVHYPSSEYAGRASDLMEEIASLGVDLALVEIPPDPDLPDSYNSGEHYDALRGGQTAAAGDAAGAAPDAQQTGGN